MRQFSVFILLLCYFASSAQHKEISTPYDKFIQRFNAKMDTVQWLCEYDEIAWWTSDSVSASSKEEQAKLGSEWFCYFEKPLWHAIYGKFQNGSFQMIFHYEVDSANTIRRSQKKVDTSISNPYARALVNGSSLVNAYPDSIRVRFNQYIKRNNNGSISIWFLPAFTSNSVAVYGGEFNYTYDPTGNHLIQKSEYSQGYRGFKPDAQKEILLDYTNLNEPSLGSIFFVWYYRKYFNKITLKTKDFNSTVFRDGPNTYYWVHAAKQ